MRDGKGDITCQQRRLRLIDRDTGEECYPKQQRLISHTSDRVKEAEEGAIEEHEKKRNGIQRKSTLTKW